jgi:aminocarboxymuconate-semialdehyde decarboxylase
VKIDMHNHAIPESCVNVWRGEPAFGVGIQGDQVTGGSHVPWTLFRSFTDPRAKLAELESKRLEAAVVSPAPPVFSYEHEPELGEAMARAFNAGMVDFCAAAPDRLRWMAHAPMRAPERAAVVLEEAARAGCVGVEVATMVDGRRLDEPRFDVFWAAAERLGLPVMIHPYYNQPHPGLDAWYLQNVIGNLLETTLTVERLICAGVLDRHPDLTVVAVHSGGYFPYQAGRLRHARTVRPELESAPEDPWAYVGRIKVDTITHDVPALAYLVSRMGADNVLMGTDLPFDMASARPVDDLEQAVAGATARRVAEENAARLFRFGD